ncbi:aconitate hydratase 1 [Candidatus Wirthbacteria bacterium CG2_30_54_11]|uniref:Aconitate hydratase n=1 Tax=Candidatus Wirthbacteria bacterium CG2_30_54_11 TaxID=1817892 RepID=A0A1J5IRL6_9BACT|nr:MAG: aconitate hydratase 1 [Candidatus Wirthbacteria bacterium CG2_30_54_11]
MFDPAQMRSRIKVRDGEITYFSLPRLEQEGMADISHLPYSIRILLESSLRNYDDFIVKTEDIVRLANWNAASPDQKELAFFPGRVLLQDLTGVPAVVDLAALRSAMKAAGGDPQKINPLIPLDLVIDHSVHADVAGCPEAMTMNVDKEFERNQERYSFLKWGADSFANFRALPPATGIVHQINLEYLASVVMTKKVGDEVWAYPDSLIGTDSHTTMINGLGVVGWGVGGIEAEAVMLGQPYYLLPPKVVGVRLTGKLREGVTATDLVLTLTSLLRKHGVVGKFVEYFGDGVDSLTLPERAVVANMAPEYGATVGYFPVDKETIRYLRLTGREDLVELVETYTKAQGLFRDENSVVPTFSETLELDLNTIETCLAGPKKPQQLIKTNELKQKFSAILTAPVQDQGYGVPADLKDKKVAVTLNGKTSELEHGSLIIAAISSCTNTSCPEVMVGAGLLAQKAVAKGLTVPPFVKTSLAPGSQVVESYLKDADLLAPLEKLGFHIVGFGCTTCIGNSGPVDPQIAAAVKTEGMVLGAIISGNRNFEGRLHPSAKANFLASPALVIAYAIAGTVKIDLRTEPLGQDNEGHDVFLKDIWPDSEEIQSVISRSVRAEMFEANYADAMTRNQKWNGVSAPVGPLYVWEVDSTYIREPSFFENMPKEATAIEPIMGASVLILAGDGTTTDHISPAGSIQAGSPAAKYLEAHGVGPKEFNSYGSRRGNHEVMVRGTFANVRFRNLLVPDQEGGITRYLPTGEVMSIYDASMKYQETKTPLIVLAGKDYGMGSSRDWAAKGQYLLGIKAVIFESIERIHRSNIIGMGILPLQFRDGETAASLGLTGQETFDIAGLSDSLTPGQTVEVIARTHDGSSKAFETICRMDSAIEIEYFRHGGIMRYVLRQLLK